MARRLQRYDGARSLLSLLSHSFQRRCHQRQHRPDGKEQNYSKAGEFGQVMRVRPVHVSFFEEPRNPLSNRHSSFHVSYSPLCVVCFYKSEVKGPRLTRVPSENVKVLNGALQMTRNPAERVGRLHPRLGRFAWSFPSLNLDRSHNEVATVWPLVERLYASSRDRFCLWRGPRPECEQGSTQLMRRATQKDPSRTGTGDEGRSE